MLIVQQAQIWDKIETECVDSAGNGEICLFTERAVAKSNEAFNRSLGCNAAMENLNSEIHNPIFILNNS